MVTEIKEVEEYRSAVSENDLVVVTFGAPWCRNCKVAFPAFRRIAEELTGMRFLKVDVTRHEDLAMENGVSSLPSYVFLKAGEKVDSYFGSKWEKVEERIRAHAARSTPQPDITDVPTPATTATISSSPPTATRDSADTNDDDQEHAAKRSRKNTDLPVQTAVSATPVQQHITVVSSAESRPLNVASFPGGVEVPAAPLGAGKSDGLAVSRRLHEAVLGMYSEHLGGDGSWVDYSALSRSAAFAKYVTQTAELQTLSLGDLNEVERKAFLVNLYCALCIHGNVVFGAPSPSGEGSIASFRHTRYRLGGGGSSSSSSSRRADELSLDEIEHGLLRGNAPHPSTKEVCFSEGDPRLSWALPLDARVHFALVCGAKACPAIRVLDAANLEQGLDLATRVFCEGDVEVGEVCDGVLPITLSRLFLWYATDFGTTPSGVLRWISSHVSAESGTKIALDRALEMEARGEAAVQMVYREYDWTSNNKP